MTPNPARRRTAGFHAAPFGRPRMLGQAVRGMVRAMLTARRPDRPHAPPPRHSARGNASRRGGPAAAILGALQVGFLVWAVVEIARDHAGDAVALVAMFLVLQVPRLLRLPLVFDAAFLVAWTLQALGQVAGFWSRISWWDTLVHCALPAVLAPTAYVLLVRVRVLPDLLGPVDVRTHIGSVMVVFLIAAGFGTLYELYEWFADVHFGMHYQPDNTDTMTDILANDLGGLAGGLWLTLASRRARMMERARVPR